MQRPLPQTKVGQAPTIHMKTEFTDRNDLIDYVRTEFPTAESHSPHVSPTIGGRRAAEQALSTINPTLYTKTRNRLDGAVTRLSPYIRHGILELAEVRNHALSVVRNPQKASKLINELGWRDYFQRVYRAIGNDIWTDLESYKTGFAADSYADELPEDLLNGETGEPAIDGFVRELYETGYLHNHARMWLAGYVIHWRRVRWQVGAEWFLTHLLDGDPASNNLSWQWVASTFSHKPYIFNQENLDRNCAGFYPSNRGVFDASYEMLSARLFPNLATGNEQGSHGGDSTQKSEVVQRLRSVPALAQTPNGHTLPSSAKRLVWLHGDNLNPQNDALQWYPNADAVWVWDEDLLDQWNISLKRMVFLYESLIECQPAEGHLHIRRGDVAEQLLHTVRDRGAHCIVTMDSPSPRFRAICKQLHESVPLEIIDTEPLIGYQGNLDLRRFSRYWRKVERTAYG